MFIVQWKVAKSLPKPAFEEWGTTPFLLFAGGTIASSILITRVYNHTQDSALLTFLFHKALQKGTLSAWKNGNPGKQCNIVVGIL